MQKKFTILIVLIVILAVISVLFFILKPKVSSKEKIADPNPYLNSKIEAKTFEENGKWGYDISIDGNLYVHQPTIPAVGGNNGFNTKEDAEKTAELVISKIRKNEMPPSVTREELKNIGVLK